MKALIILATFLTVPALAEVEFTLIPDRIEASATETVTNTGEETATAEASVTGEKHRPETNPIRQTDGGITAEDDWMTPERGMVDKEVVDGKTNRRTSEDMNSSRSNRRGPSHNTSRSNTSRFNRLDTDDDGDGISDVRRCNAKDNDCDDGVIDQEENSTRKSPKK